MMVVWEVPAVASQALLSFALEETGENGEGKCIAEKQTDRLDLELSKAEAKQSNEREKQVVY
ncbi:predicted protein [Arabidopsis lyrata subsp. lyrata]|uniref:Predicted protein n=1 Tax=Arabidopsis lyrata subsp. lyrata TaxID=81972 RepID=D7MXJ4_ARALL|nr:predicted protein [Arabidopsis lyrata subsp. lyrata]